MSPPNTLRVAGICAKKWTATPSRIAVSPCSDANKENLTAGPFWVLDCCTNRTITRVSEGLRLPPNSDHTEMRRGDGQVGGGARMVTASPDGWL